MRVTSRALPSRQSSASGRAAGIAGGRQRPDHADHPHTPTTPTTRRHHDAEHPRDGAADDDDPQRRHPVVPAGVAPTEAMVVKLADSLGVRQGRGGHLVGDRGGGSVMSSPPRPTAWAAPLPSGRWARRRRRSSSPRRMRASRSRDLQRHRAHRLGGVRAECDRQYVGDTVNVAATVKDTKGRC